MSDRCAPVCEDREAVPHGRPAALSKGVVSLVRGADWTRRRGRPSCKEVDRVLCKGEAYALCVHGWCEWWASALGEGKSTRCRKGLPTPLHTSTPRHTSGKRHKIPPRKGLLLLPLATPCPTPFFYYYVLLPLKAFGSLDYTICSIPDLSQFPTTLV